MIKRYYFASGRAAKKDGRSYRILHSHFTMKSWRPDSIQALKWWIEEQEIGEDETLEIFSFSRLPRWF